MTATLRPVSLNDVMRCARPLMMLALLTASCGQADETRVVPATSSPLASPTAAEVTPSRTPTSARYTSSVLVAAVPSAESLTVYDGQLVIALVMLGARPPDTSSQLATIPISGGVPAVMTGTYRDGGVAVTSLASGPDGVYVTTVSNSRLADNEVYRLAGGVHTTVAGGPGSPTTLSNGNGDGGPAVAAAVQGPSAVAFGRRGEIFVAEYGDGRVRRVDRNGIITTFAGSGTCVGGLSPPTPAPAVQVALCGSQLLAADRAGLLYVARKGSTWIDVIDESGMLRVFATDVDVDALHVAPSGEVFASESSRGGRLLRYDTAGHATVVATELGAIADFAFAPNGKIYVLHWPPPMIGGRVNRITVLSPTVSALGDARVEVCYENQTWQRPSAVDEAAYLAAFPRYKDVRVDDDSFEAKFFRQLAFLWDTRASSAGGDMVALSGLWSDAGLATASCPFERLVLIGYAPSRLGVTADDVGLLDVAPAPGYRVLAIAGSRPSRIVVGSVRRRVRIGRSQRMIERLERKNAPPLERIVNELIAAIDVQSTRPSSRSHQAVGQQAHFRRAQPR